MQKITWTATDDGNMYIATNEGGFQIGHVRIKLAKSDLPVLAVIANWTTKSFALVQHAKDWVEEQYNYVEDAIENA